MKWLTLTEIGHRARSKKGALEVSYESWNQRYNATANELRQALKDGKIRFGCDYCGLCRHFWPHCENDCPLGKSDMCCVKIHSLYTQAWRAEENWRRTSTSSNWWAWKRTAKALRDKLKELMNE